MQNRFKAGDVVTVHKPKNTNQYPSWTRNMDRFDKDSLTVKGTCFNDYGETMCYLHGGGGYTYNILWLEPDETFEGNV